MPSLSCSVSKKGTHWPWLAVQLSCSWALFQCGTVVARSSLVQQKVEQDHLKEENLSVAVKLDNHLSGKNKMIWLSVLQDPGEAL